MKRNFLVSLILLIVGLSCISLSIDPACASEPKINMDAVLSKRVPVLLEFGRGWCVPCKFMKPVLDDMGRLYSGKALVLTVDMDANRDLVRQFNIRVMPTQVFLSPTGKEFFRNEGTLEREQIVQIFAKMGLQGPPPRAGASQVPVSRTTSR